jgi:pyruvate formate-lyase/glycerol dehydratase family glycyl radical enzyme
MSVLMDSVELIKDGKVPEGAITEINEVIALTDRVAVRRQARFDATPHVCAERSRLVTESWKETEGQPLDLRRAKLFQKVMEGITVSIWDGELIVGSQSKYLRGAGPAIDYSPGTTVATLAAEKVTLNSEVGEATLSESERLSLLEDVEFWKGRAPGNVVAEQVTRAIPAPLLDMNDAHIFSLGSFEVPITGRAVNHARLMVEGIDGTRARIDERIAALDYSDWDTYRRLEFLQAARICCDAFATYIRRHAELARDMAQREEDITRRAELELIAENCEWISSKPPSTFHQALQLVWLTHVANDLEAPTGGAPLGRLDQYTFPLYQADISEGRITRQGAAELLGCLWVKLSETENILSVHDKQIGSASNLQDVTIGGVTRDGRDATNDLTFLILEVIRQLKLTQPPVYFRYHPSMSEEVLLKAIEANRDHGGGIPCFMNDGPTLLKLTDRGLPLTDARDWVCAGCIAILEPSGSTGDPGYMFNKIKAFELALNDGIEPRSGLRLGVATGDPRDFTSFEELYDAFIAQVEYLVGVYIDAWRLTQQVRREVYSIPFGSILLDDCIAKGKGILQGGMKYPWLKGDYADVGHQNVADGLTALRHLVFERQVLSMDEVLTALKDDFEGHEEVRRLLLAAPKYGNDDDYADEMFNRVTNDTMRIMAQPDLYGKPMYIIRGGASQHYWAGNTLAALPDGRKAWEPTADGNLSPVQGADTHGPTAVLLSATKTNHTEYAMTTVLNMKVMPSLLQSKNGMRNLLSLIRTYFERGGWHIQFNMIDPEVLLEAKADPQKHRELVVRVAGYSAYFIELSPKIQDEIIGRTLHAC